MVLKLIYIFMCEAEYQFRQCYVKLSYIMFIDFRLEIVAPQLQKRKLVIQHHHILQYFTVISVRPDLL